MKLQIPLAISLLLIWQLPGRVNAQDYEVEPTELKSFVRSQSVVVESEYSLGQLVSSQSTLNLYAIEAADRANPGSEMSGVRIDLATNASRTSVFLDHDQLRTLAREMQLMKDGLERQRAGDDPFSLARQVGQGGVGTASCWMPENPERILCPSYRFDNGFESFHIQVLREDERFPFETTQMAELGTLFQHAYQTVSATIPPLVDLYSDVEITTPQPSINLPSSISPRDSSLPEVRSDEEFLLATVIEEKDPVQKIPLGWWLAIGAGIVVTGVLASVCHRKLRQPE